MSAGVNPDARRRDFIVGWDGPSALLPPRQCAAFAPVLRAALDRARSDGHRDLEEHYAAVEAMEAIAARWQSALQAKRLPPPGSEVANTPEAKAPSRSMSTTIEISAAEAAIRKGCSSRRIRQMIAEHKLRGRLLDDGWFVDAADLERHLKENT